MSPALMEGDIVAWTPTDIKDVRVGDVIVFKSEIHWPDEKILVHRVSNIGTTRSGRILLETKGDNNEWTDQAGPHIPEPHIRESNLIGKVLSVGQQPLKIPFIGYLGVWINQGLNLISQPSSSKEPASYAGIFAPLTISIVILVVLLFMIPEKATTIKEKIHLNIFGRKPLKIKRTLISFLIAYIVFLSVIHVFAYDSTTGSVGINEASPSSGLNFGRINPGSESISRSLPLINPSTMPIKGVIYSKGELGNYVSGQVFILERGEEKSATVKATAPNGSISGAYSGDVMIYSSPFWLIFPDEFIQGILSWNAEATVFILDFLSALILTTITMFMLISITFVGDQISNWRIDKSWRYPSRLIVKGKTVKKVASAKSKVKNTVGRGIGSIINIDLTENKFKEKISEYAKKPVIASLVIMPIIFILEDKVLAMLIAVLIAGALAYFISCKIRNKIILTTLIVMLLAVAHMMITSNMIIISQKHTMLETLALSVGAFGIYLLLLVALLVPFALISWGLTRFIRNLKERKDPLLSLEGSCDL